MHISGSVELCLYGHSLQLHSRAKLLKAKRFTDVLGGPPYKQLYPTKQQLLIRKHRRPGSRAAVTPNRTVAKDALSLPYHKLWSTTLQTFHVCTFQQRAVREEGLCAGRNICASRVCCADVLGCAYAHTCCPCCCGGDLCVRRSPSHVCTSCCHPWHPSLHPVMWRHSQPHAA